MSKNTSVQGQKQAEQPIMAGEEDSAAVRRWWKIKKKKKDAASGWLLNDRE